mmetsp:Transcript_7357/g.13633  ORF Transcript_7357/g.13633 Transcript_7357/m.13633 type:complete len:272 (-) Transcript_7357:4200-5015(-)
MKISSSSPIKRRSQRVHSLLSVELLPPPPSVTNLWLSRFKLEQLRPTPLKQLDKPERLCFDKESVRPGRQLRRGYNLLDKLIGKSTSPEISPERTIVLHESGMITPRSPPEQLRMKSRSMNSNKQRLRELLNAIISGKPLGREAENVPLTDIERVIDLKYKSTKKRHNSRELKSRRRPQQQLNMDSLYPNVVEVKKKIEHRNSSVSARPSYGNSRVKEVVVVTNLPKLPFGKHSTYNREDLSLCFKRKVCRDWFTINNSRRRSPTDEALPS